MTKPTPEFIDVTFEQTDSGIDILQWPFAIYSGEVGINLVTQNRSGGASLSGLTQIAGKPVQLWSFTMDTNTLHPKVVRLFRATLARARGRRSIFRVPIRDPRYEAKPRTGAELPGPVRIRHSHGAPFSSGASYRINGNNARVTVNQGETEMTTNEDIRDHMAKGVFFGIGGDLHVCTGVDGETVHFEPAARRNHFTNQISFRPSLYARLTDDRSGSLALEQGRWGASRISFIEEVL